MPRFMNFRYTRGPKSIGKLLEEATDAKLAALYMRAWVKERFSPDSTDYTLLAGCLKKQEISTKSALEFYQYCEGEASDDSIVGVRTLRDLERVYAKREQQQQALAERIRVIKETGNITYLEKYRAAKARMSDQPGHQPKGAA